jgi:hypothetical protein
MSKRFSLREHSRGGEEMEKNVGGMDRYARLVSGVLLLAAAFLNIVSGAVLWGAVVVGVIMLATGLTQFCPINKALGINTCKVKAAK